MSRNCHLIIGNGFNLALKEAIQNNFDIKLSYKDIIKGILDKIKINLKKDDEKNKLSYQKLYNFIDKNKKLNDVEWLLIILENSVDCLKSTRTIFCTVKHGSFDIIKQDILLLKKLFIEVITDKNYHPKWDSIFNSKNDTQLNKCAKNLQLFYRIFTINYDLILYWLMNNKKLLFSKNNNKGFKDGFSTKIKYKKNNLDEQIKNYLANISSERIDARIFYLHGAIHLLRQITEENLGSTYKIVRGYYRVEEIKSIEKFNNIELIGNKTIFVFKKNNGWDYKEKCGLKKLIKDNNKEVDFNNQGIRDLRKNLIKLLERNNGSKDYLNLLELRQILLKTYENFDHLIVLGGAKEKTNQIFNNYYLHKCYGKLNNSNGTYVVYGCNLTGNSSSPVADNHIWRQVIKNSKKLFIGLYVESNSNLTEETQKLKKKFRSLKDKDKLKEIYCFDSKKINIWKDDFKKLINETTVDDLNITKIDI